MNLFEESCPVRYIITVDKLREGWDCSFAYVLCSVRDIGSKTAVEQILGRVLRMPNATRREHQDLNRAYAFVTETTAGAAESLDVITQAMQGNGFSPEEAAQAVTATLPGIHAPLGGLFATDRVVPVEKGDLFPVPQLCLWLDGELEPLDDVSFLRGEWRLADYSAELTEKEYSAQGPDSKAYEIDVDDRDKVRTRYISNLQRHLAMIVPTDIRTPEKLVLWLDSHVPHPDIVQPQSLIFLGRLIDCLIKTRGTSLDDLVRDRLRLREAVEAKINGYRADAATKGFQAILDGIAPARAEVSAERVFTYPIDYPVGEPYQGTHQFAKHYYRSIAAMNHEEELCAQLIDSLPDVKYLGSQHRAKAGGVVLAPDDYRPLLPGLCGTAGGRACDGSGVPRGR